MDVDMADVDASQRSPAPGDILETIAVGRLDALAACAHGGEEALERELLMPFLPLLTRLDHCAQPPTTATASPSPLSVLLRGFEQVNNLREYVAALSTLTAAELDEDEPQLSTTDGVALAAVEPAVNSALPLYRRFEAAGARERCRIVLREVLHATGDGSVPTSVDPSDRELFRNPLYKDDVAAILATALAIPGIESRLGIAQVTAFCLSVPLGAELLEVIARNDPASFESMLEHIVLWLAQVPVAVISPLNAVAESSVASGSTTSSHHQIQAVVVSLAQLSPLFATRLVSRLQEIDTTPLAPYLVFHLLLEVPSLRRDHYYATFVLQWLSSVTDRPTAALHGFLRATVGPVMAVDTDVESPSPASSFWGRLPELEDDGRYVMTRFRELLVEEVTQFHPAPTMSDATTFPTQTPSRFAVVALLKVFIGLLVNGSMHPEEHEINQLLRFFDRTAKDIQQLGSSSRLSPRSFERVVSLMYVLVLFLCAPLAPSLNKMPSQREESIKLVLSLSQQCIYSLYNTKAACPLFILSSVLLYTKSPSLLPFLGSLLGDAFPLTTTMKMEYLFGVGDVILKPILTENVMAREILTAFSPLNTISTRRVDLMEEMALRSMHGLLTEKSFIRHHHARKLEDWMAHHLERVSQPAHPLMLNVLFEWIENYIVAFEYPISQKPSLQLAIQPLRPSILSQQLMHEALFTPVSKKNVHIWVRGALSLAYALQFNQRLRQSMSVSGTKLNGISNPVSDEGGISSRNIPDVVLRYDLRQVPIKRIFDFARRRGGVGQELEWIACSLLRLITEEYPQLSHTRLDRPICLLDIRPSRLVYNDEMASLARAEPPVTVDWNATCHWLCSIKNAPVPDFQKAFGDVVKIVLPAAVLQNGVDDDADRENCSTIISDLFERRARMEYLDPDMLLVLVAQALCHPSQALENLRHPQSRNRIGHHSSRDCDSCSVTKEQMCMQPFYVLKHVHPSALRSPALVRLAIRHALLLREESMFELQRDSLVAKKPQTEAPAVNPGSDAKERRHVFVQDCIFVHELLHLLQRTKNDPATAATIGSALNFLFDQVDHLSSHGAETHDVHVILAIHLQGYDPTLIQFLVDNVPSLKKMWLYWIQQPSPEQCAASSTTSRRSSSEGKGSLNPQSKAVLDYVAEVSADKDILKWQFRLQVFFALCGRYFVPNQASIVLPTLKQILNRLRGIVVSNSSSSAKGATAAPNLGDAATRVAFVDTVVNDIVGQCGKHPDLRTEVCQFLVNLKRHIGGPNVSRHGSPALDRVIFTAYQRLLESL